MEPSFIGVAIFTLLWLLAWFLGSGAFIGLMASLPLGSTAFVTLSALGGSSPLIYALFALLLLAQAFLRPHALAELRRVFAEQRCAWVVSSLMILAVVGTILLPRLFAGETVALLPVEKVYAEFPLRPSSKNVSQGGSFLLGTLVYFAVSLLLLEKSRCALVARAFFAFCITHTACGLADLAAKHAGLGDVFAPIRTAGYAMLANARVAGFPRLTGAMPEASAFALATLACLGFSHVYWRGTGSRLALWITLVNVTFVVLSTSTTAYVGFAVLCLPLAWRMVGGTVRDGRPSAQDLRITLLGLAAGAVGFAVLVSSNPPASVVQLANVVVIDKPASTSGVERFHFNAVSVRNFLDTYGLGVGLGSSRSSSWPLAVLAQLGLLGTLLMAPLVFVLFRGMTDLTRTPENAELIVAGNAVRASALGGLLAASLSGGSADPGVVFFIALAAVTSWRRHASTPRAAIPDREVA